MADWLAASMCGDNATSLDRRHAMKINRNACRMLPIAHDAITPQSADKKKADLSNLLLKSAFFLNSLGWLMGLEPTTTGITIRDSTN